MRKSPIRPLRTNSQARRKRWSERCWLPGLEHNLRLLDRVAHHATVGDREREGLLTVDVFLCLARRDHHESVPVVRSADLDGVDVFTVEDFAEIGTGVASVIRLRSGFLGVMLVDQSPRRLAAADLAVPIAGALAVGVADGDQLYAVVAEERLDVVETLITGADHRQRNPIAGCGSTRQPQRTTGDDRGKRHTCRRCKGGLTQESAAR